MQSIGVFVFVPFCKIKCTYCDFNVYAHLARLMDPYADVVVEEIQRSLVIPSGEVARNLVASIDNETSRSARGDKRRAHSIYFGGGTPSIVPAAQIEKILRALRETFVLAPDAEISLEANPATADEEKIRAWRALGVNRLSIGVQSFDDATLKRLNRGHTAADAIAMYDQARRAGFDNISFDFIFGLPLQTLDEWRATLDRALELQPEHLSLYGLRVEEKTGLEFQIARGVYPTPDDDLAADMYEMAEEMLEAAGYAQYEISNWARRVGARHSRDLEANSNQGWNEQDEKLIEPDMANASPLQSRHNLTYWLNQPYLGFGAGAHSYFNGARFSNLLSPVEYIEKIQRGESVIATREEIAREMEMAETMFLGLRLMRGISLEQFRARFGIDAREHYADQVFWRFLP
ncbi:MAG: radical SAM family heme chaperone HemW [Chloroflexi bacterium]|nr:radical SAM family heme chaperone HemW [Chloroflexota bacterium]